MKIELITEDELVEQYNDILDGSIEPFKVGHRGFDPHQVLKEVDPIAYNCGLDEYEDSLSEDGIYSDRSYDGDDFYKCPECGELYDDEDEAKECCE